MIERASSTSRAPAGVTLTNATGAYGLALSEHMLAQTLAMMKKLYLYYDNQHQALWHDEGPVTSLYGATVVVVGFGNIGRNFGQRVKAMGAHVIGLRRRQGAVPPEADEMGDMAHFNEYLAKADIVASCLPDTPETYHIYDAARFAAVVGPLVEDAGHLHYAAHLRRLSSPGDARLHRPHRRR